MVFVDNYNGEICCQLNVFGFKPSKCGVPVYKRHKSIDVNDGKDQTEIAFFLYSFISILPDLGPREGPKTCRFNK